MYNSQLETFLKVVENGSFSKAADKLYISPTAVIKQINILEERIDVKLFIRSPRGLKLTEAGKIFLKDTKHIIKFSKNAIDRAKSVEKEIKNTIRVGISPMTPENSIIELWDKVRAIQPDLKLQLIPFENTLENAVEILANLGKKIDIVVGIYDEKLLERRGCSALWLEDALLSCMIPLNHKLIEKEVLEIEDLYGENVLLLNKGYFLHIDKVRDEFETKHPKINIVNFDFYNLDIFNKAENDNDILIGISKTFKIHPLLRNTKVNWNFKIPYGILHSSTPSKNVEIFLKVVSEIIKNEAVT